MISKLSVKEVSANDPITRDRKQNDDCQRLWGGKG